MTYTTTTNLFDTVALTRHSSRGADRPLYTTNDGAIQVYRTPAGTWAVSPRGGTPFVTDLPSLESAVDFVLGARAMMRPVTDEEPDEDYGSLAKEDRRNASNLDDVIHEPFVQTGNGYLLCPLHAEVWQRGGNTVSMWPANAEEIAAGGGRCADCHQEAR